jgi:ribosomal protein L13E
MIDDKSVLKVVLPGETVPDESPFAPVFVAMKEIMTTRGASVGQVMDATVSIMLTTALNLHVQFRRDDPESPSVERIMRVLCIHAMQAAHEAEAGAAAAMGVGATKQ